MVPLNWKTDDTPASAEENVEPVFGPAGYSDVVGQAFYFRPDTMHIIDDGNIRTAHLGDLGYELDEEQIRQPEDRDVCMIPVGGHYTIDGNRCGIWRRERDGLLYLGWNERGKQNIP